MDWILFICLALGAYVLGSIPTAVWVGKWFFNIDVREHGSGNAGFSNALRVLGPKAGIPVLLVDVAKGYFAVKLAHFVPFQPFGSLSVQLVPILFGLLAFLGHLFPVFARFKGGKGVATGLGMVLAIFPMGALIGLPIFLFIIFTFRMMSLGSMIAGISLPFTYYYHYRSENWITLIFFTFISAMILYTHRSNIQRIIKGEENRIWFRKKN